MVANEEAIPIALGTEQGAKSLGSFSVLLLTVTVVWNS